MLVATVGHSILRPVNPASRSITLICQRHSLLHNTPCLHSHVSSIRKFHATDFFSATHRYATRRVYRPGKPLGPWERFSRRFNTIPKNYLIFGILGINGVIFAAWSYVQIFQVRLIAAPFTSPPISSLRMLERVSLAYPSHRAVHSPVNHRQAPGG
jgi:hypothetical protein